MRGYGKIVDFPKYIKNSGKYIIAPFSHVVQIKYPNGNIILIEEIDNKERKRLEYNIKKAFSFFTRNYLFCFNGRIAVECIFLPFDIDTNTRCPINIVFVSKKSALPCA